MSATSGHGSPDAAVERDRLTRRRLAAAAARKGRPSVISFTSRWWDGACHVPCLLVRVDGRRLRVVETHGATMVLPGRAGAARTLLAEWRRTPLGPALATATASTARLRPAVSPGVRAQVQVRFEPVNVPQPRRRPAAEVAVRIAQEVDVMACTVARCGGLRVVPPPGTTAETACCPSCGIAA